MAWKKPQGSALQQTGCQWVDQVAHRSVQSGLKLLQGRRIHNLPEQHDLAPVKYFLLASNLNLPSFSLKPLPPQPVSMEELQHSACPHASPPDPLQKLHQKLHRTIHAFIKAEPNLGILTPAQGLLPSIHE